MTDQPSEEFDVFLCHNSKDKPAVKAIGERLKSYGLRPWLDEWELRPGLPWQRLLEEQIASIRSAAVFVGKDGLGPWQQQELEGFLRHFVSRGIPVIPVVLENAPEKPSLPIFLSNMTWVDFRTSSPDPMQQLVWGISGDRIPDTREQIGARVGDLGSVTVERDLGASQHRTQKKLTGLRRLSSHHWLRIVLGFACLLVAVGMATPHARFYFGTISRHLFPREDDSIPSAPPVKSLGDGDSNASDEDSTQWLQQNWDVETRQHFYTTSQGSRMMPYAWFSALEISDSEASFVSHLLPKLGFISNDNTLNNPDRLPVGFVADTDWSGRKFVGLNCAACHTNQIVFEDVTLQIDGAPALVDMWAMVTGIGASIKATIDTPDKFSRFAATVLRQNPSSQAVEQLRDEINRFSQSWDQFIVENRTRTQWGRGRMDAFGTISNRIAATELDMPQNSRPPDAPVSYPFLWGTSFQDRLHWTGNSPNTNNIERLGRMIGESFCMFSLAELKRAFAIKPYYRTSVRRTNQVRQLNRLDRLYSPSWPEQLASIDTRKKDAGKLLYRQHCVQCHEVIPHGRQSTLVAVVMTPISELGTDPKAAIQAASGSVLTGRLAGSEIPGFDPLELEVPRELLMYNVVRGAMFSPFPDVGGTAADDSFFQSLLTELGATEEESLRFADNYSRKLNQNLRDAANIDATNLEEAKAGAAESALSYKAGPLAGIWATAPYLHNGSVPNLYELLQPAEKRPMTFFVGSNEFDTKKVGFKTDERPGTTEFDVSKSGNSNAGHDTYGTFSEQQLWQIVEYLKSL